MLINIQDDIIRLHAAGLLTRLLADKTTGKNIMWATDVYAEHGTKYERNEQIMPELITGSNTGIIKTRARKAFEQQTERTRRRAEVFTPLWICKKMTEHFYTECASGQDTDKLINSRQLEITCGEAPFLVSRYDTTTGEPIPISERIGLLDRKLQLVGKITENEDDWLKLAKRAYESTYGYEFQGDNLLIARVNLIETFSEYMQECCHRKPTLAEMRPIINIITWNVWQMDGLNGRIPYKTADEDNVQLSFFEEEKTAPEQPPCKIFDWRARRPLEYNIMGKGTKTMKFDFVIGNPPYQETMDSTSDNPIYNYFMDAANSVSEIVELITPARFLFNAGKTPKDWNEAMLNDEHFKVLFYEPDSSKVFSNTDIKGGVAITYRDNNKIFGKIETYTPYAELNNILSKVKKKLDSSISDIVFSPESYKFTKDLYEEKPEILEMKTIVNGKEVSLISKGHEYDLVSNIFDKLNDIIFFKDKPIDNDEYIQIAGRKDNTRINMWVKRKYVAKHKNLYAHKLLFPKSNGSGRFGEPMSSAMVALPDVGHTQTFISIGYFKTKYEAESLNKYLCGKFARALLGILKVTQDNKKSVWKYVPLQDFTSNSDIDWSKSISEIDKQLYAKYGLTDDEITFIETHVKEMS